MKISWKGAWREGELSIETETLEELEALLDKLPSLGKSPSRDKTPPQIIPADCGCTDAIRILLNSDWGKQPRSMNEINFALQSNALCFSKGTLSGTLTLLTERGELERTKNAGIWFYVLKEK